MTEREYHIDGLDFALRIFTEIFNERTAETKIVNALAHIRQSAKFLRAEQAAFDVLFPKDED